MTLTIDQIRNAGKRLSGIAIRTPLHQNHYLNELLASDIYLKLENLQHIGAFKFRGAYNRLSQLSAQEKSRGVVAFSSGNHAQGIAYAARLLGMSATIVMPADAPAVKVSGTIAYGATVRFYDRATESREAIAAQIAQESGGTVVPAFDDIDVMAGQGTCGIELVEQLGALGKEPAVLLSPCGGGGLLAGVSTAVQALVPECKIYGVEPAGFDDHRSSLQIGERQQVRPGHTSFCDALLAPMPGELTWEINRKTTTGFVAVTDDEVAHAISFAFRYLKLVIEPGGAVGLAAVLHKKLDIAKKVVCVVISGGNVDAKLFGDCLAQHPTP